ncbi:hypothetical protein HII36_16035 [Nonomuraea sp. NN258]|nr:hypothetical protein [Nonomuraea antri]
MKIAAVAGFLALITFAWDGTDQQEVSKQQYQTMTEQCRYADTRAARAECLADVKKFYRVGKSDPTLDCRTYAGVSVCGHLTLSRAERACVDEAVKSGTAYRRAEVECYAFG